MKFLVNISEKFTFHTMSFIKVYYEYLFRVLKINLFLNLVFLTHILSGGW